MGLFVDRAACFLTVEFGVINPGGLLDEATMLTFIITTIMIKPIRDVIVNIFIGTVVLGLSVDICTVAG